MTEPIKKIHTMLRAQLLCVLVALLLCGAAMAAGKSNVAKKKTHSASNLFVTEYDPVAATSAVVVSGAARFTVLTSRVIRIEYADNSKFEDRATMAIVNRKTAVPKFTSGVKQGVLIIETNDVVLSYLVGASFEDAGALNVTSKSSEGVRWQYGMTSAQDTGNLLGTIRTLDRQEQLTLNCSLNMNRNFNPNIEHESDNMWEGMHCAWGLVSRSGWALYDDQKSAVLDSDFWWADSGSKSSKSYNKDDVDAYIFMHGTDYKAAIADYAKIGGTISMFPRYANGVMITRWYNYNNHDVQSIVGEFESRGCPMDAFIFDMNWHTKNDWTGYSFDRNLFPADSQAYVLDMIHAKGINVGANIHDANGVGSFEDEYEALCDAVGYPSDGTAVPLELGNKTMSYALEDVVMKPLYDVGIDFAWIDWQQGNSTLSGIGGMNPTMMTNHLRSTTSMRNGLDKRDLVLGRWPGMGGHRYQAGFSGDVNGLTWANLAYQPYFSATASNVLFGWWSHDITGPGDDLEMYTRWVQWGAFSGVFRAHDRGMSAGECALDGSCSVVIPFECEEPFASANVAVLRERLSFLPYIYNAQRESYVNGLGLVRPMYYDWPEDDEAYAMDAAGNSVQYMFGDDMLVAPVVSAAGDDFPLTSKTIWLPQGDWIELATGSVLESPAGGKKLTKFYDITEVPVFIKAGSVIPRLPLPSGNVVGKAMDMYEVLMFDIFSGADDGSVSVYEDDPSTTKYATSDQFAHTTCAYTRSSDSTMAMEVKISTVVNAGSTKAYLPASRPYVIRLHNAIVPSDVVVNGESIRMGKFRKLGDTPAIVTGASSFYFDSDDMVVVIELAAADVNKPQSVEITWTYPHAVSTGLTNGVKGVLGHALLAKSQLDTTRSTPGQQTSVPGPAHLTYLASMGSLLDMHASYANISGFVDVLSSLPALFNLALDETAANIYDANACVQMVNWDRFDSCLCCTQDCINTNEMYDTTRIEGYQPQSCSDSDAIQLYTYYSAQNLDNWVTNSSSAPASGYTAATFTDGCALSTQVNDTIPLFSMYSKDRLDHAAVASTTGISWYKQHGYVVQSIIGYVFMALDEQPRAVTTVDGEFQYALDLLNAAGFPSYDL